MYESFLTTVATMVYCSTNYVNFDFVSYLTKYCNIEYKFPSPFHPPKLQPAQRYNFRVSGESINVRMKEKN